MRATDGLQTTITLGSVNHEGQAFSLGLSVNDRPSRLFSAQQEALQRSSGWDWPFRLTVSEFRHRDAGRST